MPVARILFYFGLVMSAVSLLTVLILPSSGLEALGGVLIAYFAWLYHLVTLPFILFLIWRSKLTLFSILILTYYLLISISGGIVVLLSTGADTTIREKIEASTDSVGFELRALSKEIHMQSMRKQKPSAEQILRLQNLLSQNPDLNRRGETSNAPLWYLAAAGEHELVKQLIENGARVEDATLYDSSPLYIAADNGHAATLSALIQTEVKLDSEYRNYSPLMAAARNGSLESVEVLLRAGADVNQNAPEGNAFSVALYKGNPDIIRALLKAGAKAQLPKHHKPAILVAFEREQNEVVQVLIEHGSGWNEQDPNTLPASLYFYQNCEFANFQMTFENGANANLRVQKSNDFLLHHIIKNPNRNCPTSPYVATLIDKGAELNTADKHNKSSLILALRHKQKETADLLALRGARCDAFDDLQDTVLTLAIRNQMLDLAKYCLDQGSDINYRSPLNNSSYALLEAVKSQNIEIVKFVFEHGALLPNTEIDLSNLFRKTNQEDIVEILLEHYASDSDPDKVLIRGIKTGLRNSTLSNKNSILSKLP